MTLQYSAELVVFLWKSGAQSRASVMAALGPKGTYAKGVNRVFRNDGDKVEMAKGLSFLAIKHLGKLGNKIARWELCPELTQLRQHFHSPAREHVLDLLQDM